MVLMNPTTPGRAVFDSRRFLTGCFTATDVMATMRPQPFLRISGRAASVSWTVDRRLRSTAFLYASGVKSSTPPGGGPPALATRMSRRPNSDAVRSTSRAQNASSATSPATGTTLRPVSRAISPAVASRASGDLELMTTSAPSLASRSATARPRPFDAPVTRAALSFSPRSTRVSPLGRTGRWKMCGRCRARNSAPAPVVCNVSAREPDASVNPR